MADWSFITNHGLVLAAIAKHPRSTARELGDDVGITERTAHKIIIDLEEAGYHDQGDIWVFRVDLSGNLVWSKCFGGREEEKGTVKILPTPDGNFMVFGSSSSRDGDVSGNATYSQYELSIWVFKIDLCAFSFNYFRSNLPFKIL